jgi:hypothetical protein
MDDNSGDINISDISGSDIDVGPLITGKVGGDVVGRDKIGGDQIGPAGASRRKRTVMNTYLGLKPPVSSELSAKYTSYLKITFFHP